MNNGIIDRENEEQSILKLAAQRQLYLDAKNWTRFHIIVGVVFPIAISFINPIIGSEEITAVFNLYTVLVMVFNVVVNDIISSKKELAASIQQEFDLYVYGMKWDSSSFGIHHNMNYMISDNSFKFKRKNKLLKEHDWLKKSQLKNWYSENVGHIELDRAIFECQKTNIRWDSGLRKVFLIVFILIMILLFIGAILETIFLHASIATALCTLTFFGPLVQYFLDVGIEIQKDRKRLGALQELTDQIENANDKSVSKLEELQSLIFEHRKACFTIPDLFYKILKDKQFDITEQAIRLDVSVK